MYIFPPFGVFKAQGIRFWANLRQNPEATNQIASIR